MLIASKEIRIAVVSMTLPMTAWPRRMRKRLEKRSAMAPPNGLRKVIATPWPNITAPPAPVLPERAWGRAREGSMLSNLNTGPAVRPEASGLGSVVERPRRAGEVAQAALDLLLDGAHLLRRDAEAIECLGGGGLPP